MRIVYLTTRNEQLANLLKDANISIPSECGGQISDKTKKWSGKITPQKADEINKSKIESKLYKFKIFTLFTKIFNF